MTFWRVVMAAADTAGDWKRKIRSYVSNLKSGRRENCTYTYTQREREREIVIIEKKKVIKPTWWSRRANKRALAPSCVRTLDREENSINRIRASLRSDKNVKISIFIENLSRNSVFFG